MSIKHSENYCANPPGRLISEMLEDRSISEKEMAEKLGLPEYYMYDLIEGDVPLTPSIAEKLETNLGMSAAFWMRYEKRYQDKLQKVNEENRIMFLEPA